MSYHIQKPSPALSPYVKFYWMMEISLPEYQKHIQRIVPSGLMELMFYSGTEPRALQTSKQFEANLMVTGQQKCFYDLEVTGKLSIFSTVFKPHGFAAFFKLPANETFNRNIALRYVNKSYAIRLEDKLHEASSFQEKIHVMEQFLQLRLFKVEANFEQKRIKSALQQINASKGIIGIDMLASHTCLSRKQFERQFSFYVGTSPKRFLKTIRFQYAVNQKAKNKHLSLTELTYQCGYYDQAHMTNDFMKLTGLTPGRYFAACEPFSDYFG